MTSDDSWVAETVGLGNEGTQVLTEFGFYVNRVALLSGHSSAEVAPVWSDQIVEHNFERQVASSTSDDAHLSLHQQYADSNFYHQRAVLRHYASSSTVPLWSFESDILTSAGDSSWVGLSGDGQTIVLLVYDQFQGRTRISVFSPESNVPVYEDALDTLVRFESAELATDGSTLVVSSPRKVLVYDLLGRNVAFELLTLGQPQHGGVSIAADGSRVAFGTPGAMTVVERDDLGAFSTSFSFDLPPAFRLRCPTLSEDGSTLVAGFQKPGQLQDARIVVVDLEQQPAPGLELLLEGGGNHQNLIEDIQVDALGERFAIGLWGDEEELIPEVSVYSVESDVPLFAAHLPGSVNAMDFSSDGQWLAVASKGVHANVWGGGGSVSLYRIGLVDVAVSGIPRTGEAVGVEHQLREGKSSQVLVSTSLLEAPLIDSEFGAGALYLDPETLVELPPSVASAEYVAVTPLELDPSWGGVGSTLYVQAVNLDDGVLSRDWVKLTLVP